MQHWFGHCSIQEVLQMGGQYVLWVSSIEPYNSPFEFIGEEQQERLHTIGVHTLEQMVGHPLEKPSNEAA